jgi:uncharacterized protein YjiS (DUF1127 family)
MGADGTSPDGGISRLERSTTMKTNTGLTSRQADDVAKVAARPAAGLVDITRQLAGNIVSWNRRQMELAELRNLDDRLLEDIGLTRADLDRAA